MIEQIITVIAVFLTIVVGGFIILACSFCISLGWHYAKSKFTVTTNTNETITHRYKDKE